MQLTTYIKDDMRRRILSGENLPYDLTLLGIAAHYSVSLTPARAAVSELLTERILRKLPNGRLDIDRGKTLGHENSTEPPAVTPPPSAADWERVLLCEIMVLTFQPQAEYLREESLARKFEIGRSVIRQTLGRLAGAGIIEHVPRCGWLVHPISEDDMTAYLEIRETLELKALDLAQSHLETEVLTRLLEGNSPPAPGEETRLDNGLHQYVIEKSGNRYIQHFFRQYTASYYTTVFNYAAPEAQAVAEMAEQHRRILNSLLMQDWVMARRYLSEHIWNQKPNLIKLQQTRCKNEYCRAIEKESPQKT